MLTLRLKALVLAGAVGGSLLPWVASDSRAQSDEAGAAAAFVPPAITLGLQRLIDNPPIGQGGGARFQDPVWSIRPANGRATVLLPIRIEAGSEAYELSRSEIGVQRARFIGWYIPDPSSNQSGATNRAGGGDDAFRVGDSRSLESLLMGEDEAGDSAADEAIEEAVDAAADVVDPVPFDAPRLARKLTIHPDATIAWGADRSFTGAELNAPSGTNLYGYLLDSQAIRAAEPPRPERLTRNANETSREFSQRRRDQQENNRALQDEFRALREAVRELPDEFREPLPEVVYAVFDAPVSDELGITGDEAWEVDLFTLDALQAVAQSNGSNGVDQATLDAIATLMRRVNNGSAIDHRAIALAVYRGGLPGQVSVGGPGYRLIETLIRSDDAAARKAAVAAIAQTVPPTVASVELLATAAELVPGDDGRFLQVASLRSTFRLGADSGDGNALRVKANEALANRAGPEAAEVLEELLRAVEPSGGDGVGNGLSNPRGTGNGLGSTEVSASIINRIDFGLIDESQRDRVIALVIRNASQSVVAAGWLDYKLLRSEDDAVIDRTLELLSLADADSTVVKPLVAELRARVFTPPQGESLGPDLDLTLNGVIPMDSASHGLIGAIKSTEPTRRALAWRVLRHFEIVGSQAAAGGQAQQAFDAILSAGKDEPATPLYLVDFIENQSDPELVSQAAERLLDLVGDDGISHAVALRAARKMVGSGHDFGRALAQMPAQKRGTAVERFYELTYGEFVAVVGLSRIAGETRLVAWFGEQLRAGVIPSARDWAAQAGTEQELLALVGGGNGDVAMAAASALALNAGGSAQQADDFAKTIDGMSSLSEDAVQAAWEPVKREIYTGRLSDVAGPYRWTLTVYASEGANNVPGGLAPAPDRGRAPARGRGRGDEGGRFDGPGPGEPGLQPPPVQARPASPGNTPGEVEATIDLGVIELNVAGDQISTNVEALLVSLAPDRLAIRIEQASSLASIDHDDLADLPLSQLAEHIDLLPIEGDAWEGAIQLPDGRTLEVTLTRED